MASPSRACAEWVMPVAHRQCAFSQCRKSVELNPRHLNTALTVGVESVLSLAVVAARLYSILRIFLDAIATGQRDQVELRAEVLALRRQVQVLERQIKRVKWTPADRMVLAALRDRLPRTAWAALRVQPETVPGLAS